MTQRGRRGSRPALGEGPGRDRRPPRVKCGVLRGSLFYAVGADPRAARLPPCHCSCSTCGSVSQPLSVGSRPFDLFHPEGRPGSANCPGLTSPMRRRASPTLPGPARDLPRRLRADHRPGDRPAREGLPWPSGARGARVKRGVGVWKRPQRLCVRALDAETMHSRALSRDRRSSSMVAPA